MFKVIKAVAALTQIKKKSKISGSAEDEQESNDIPDCWDTLCI
jgi:hypothetical protein